MNISAFKLIRKTKPLDLFDILTQGVCSQYRFHLEEYVGRVGRDGMVNNWSSNPKIDSLSIYISDSSLIIYTNKESAKNLEVEFKSWDLFYSVSSSWYNDDLYRVGFNYTYDDFETLHNIWLRNKKIDNLILK